MAKKKAQPKRQKKARGGSAHPHNNKSANLVFTDGKLGFIYIPDAGIIVKTGEGPITL